MHPTTDSDDGAADPDFGGIRERLQNLPNSITNSHIVTAS